MYPTKVIGYRQYRCKDKPQQSISEQKVCQLAFCASQQGIRKMDDNPERSNGWDCTKKKLPYTSRPFQPDLIYDIAVYNCYLVNTVHRNKKV